MAIIDFQFPTLTAKGWEVEEALTKPVIKYRKRVWVKSGEGHYHHENGIED